MGSSIAALDLGTSKSIAFVVQKDFAGKKLSVLRAESFPSKNAMRRGRIYNSDETSDIIIKLIRKLNSAPNTMQIDKIYVGIGGQSLHTQLFKIKRIIDGETIDNQLIKAMEEEANNYMPDFEENLGVVSREYYADGQLVENPKGTTASTIEARFQLVVGNPCLKRNLEKVFNKKEISVAGYFISPLATAEAVLTSEEKELGCALVEFGDGVTYISIYKNKTVKYLATLPIGGLAITKDIRSLNVSETEAEALKIDYGSAISDLADSGVVPVNREDSSRKIELKELNWIIEARVDEIVKNISAQIQVSGYEQLLDAGIVITGGGALLRDLPKYIRNQTGKEVRLADAKAWMSRSDTAISPADSCVIGLAILGKENCTKEIKKEEPVLFDDKEMGVKEKEPKNQEKTDENEQEKTQVKRHRPNIIRNSWNNFKGMFDDAADSVFEGKASDDNNDKNTANKQ